MRTKLEEDHAKEQLQSVVHMIIPQYPEVQKSRRAMYNRLMKNNKRVDGSNTWSYTKEDIKEFCFSKQYDISIKNWQDTLKSVNYLNRNTREK
jgi:hypothetical protein